MSFSLSAIVEKWKKYIDNRKTFGVLRTELSKIFNCLDRELLNGKLNAYGFKINQNKW